MTIKQLIKRLEQFPKSYEVKIHEINSPYDRPITQVLQQCWDDDKNKLVIAKIVLLEG